MIPDYVECYGLDEITEFCDIPLTVLEHFEWDPCPESLLLSESEESVKSQESQGSLECLDEGF